MINCNSSQGLQRRGKTVTASSQNLLERVQSAHLRMSVPNILWDTQALRWVGPKAQFACVLTKIEPSGCAVGGAYYNDIQRPVGYLSSEVILAWFHAELVTKQWLGQHKQPGSGNRQMWEDPKMHLLQSPCPSIALMALLPQTQCPGYNLSVT